MPEPEAPLVEPESDPPAEEPIPEVLPVAEPVAATPTTALTLEAARVEDATGDDKLWALLSYIITPIVPIVVLLMEEKKSRPFIKAHAYQSLVAGVAAVVVLMLLGLIPIIGCLTPFLAFAFWVLMIYWGVQAYGGKTVRIPVVTDFVKKQGWA